MRKKIAVMSNFIELDKMKNELSFGIFKILQIEEEKRVKRWNPIKSIQKSLSKTKTWFIAERTRA